MDEKQLIKISRRLGILRSLARISTGSKTNDKIIYSSVRDMEALLEFVYRHIQPNLFGTTQNISGIDKTEKNVQKKQLPDAEQTPLF